MWFGEAVSFDFNEEQCRLCTLLLKTLRSVGINHEVVLIRAGPLLRVERGPYLLRLWTVSGSLTERDNHYSGTPILPLLNRRNPHGWKDFWLLREWLADCDKKHNCKNKALHILPRKFYPSRLIFVAGPETTSLKLSNPKREDYVALSHCWGDPTKEEKSYVSTTSENCNERYKGFSLGDLPQTFQDAIAVTRAIGKKYLWIDSICIIQGDKGDWEREAGLMENIFASAYCTIAVTSAKSWNEGFLRRLDAPEYITVQDSSNRKLHFSPDVANFERDVLDSVLNNRDWVLQERTLSRRIIHFTENQTYWECGKFVRCENSVTLRRKPGREFFIKDPEFPQLLKQWGHARVGEFIQYLFEKYTQCGITEVTDRAVAIVGLMERIKKVLSTNAAFGILESHLVRLLLWRRIDEGFPPAIAYEQKIPSWSWMLYPGRIEFITQRTETGMHIAKKKELKLARDGNSLVAKVRKLQQVEVAKISSGYALLRDSREVGTFWPDTKDFLELSQCVIMGYDKFENSETTVYVLVVQANESDEYRRIGVAKVQAFIISSISNSGILL